MSSQLPAPTLLEHCSLITSACLPSSCRAIERGQWVLLDSANLCNPTVLDRLNPLLEPQGAPPALLLRFPPTARGLWWACSLLTTHVTLILAPPPPVQACCC